MKTLILATSVFILTACSPAFAQAPTEHCELYQELAEQVMEARQMGLPQTLIAAIAEGDKASQFIVEWAYNVDVYDGGDRENVVKEFGEQVMDKCLGEME